MIKPKLKCLFVATVVKTHINEFHLPYLHMFQSYGYETHVAARDDFAPRGEVCEIPYCDRFFPLPFSRSPFSVDNIRAYKELKSLIQTENYDVIHCHTPVGGMIARMAARTARRQGTRVFYTAHGFHFFQGAPLKNWLFYYPAERLAARWTDVLLTINREDYERAKSFPAKKVVYVPGVGVQIEKFAGLNLDFSDKRQELGIPGDAFLILMVGELSRRKNQDTVLDVMAGFQKENVYCILCGQGALQEELQQKAKHLGIEKQVVFLGFRYDIAEICAVSDVFLFPTLHEGLPVALMEAMAAGMPVVCSDVRGNHDLIVPGKGGYLTGIYDVDAMQKALRELMAHPETCQSMGAWNKKAVLPYDIEHVKEDMKAIYGFEPL